MIYPKELRIGNLVSFEGQITHVTDIVLRQAQMQPYAIGLDHLRDRRVIPHDIEPVPITKEILEKCNLRKVDDYYTSYEDEFIRFFFDGEVLHCSIGDNMNGFLYNINRYIHQFQNLYFALTGSELNYTP